MKIHNIENDKKMIIPDCKKMVINLRDEKKTLINAMDDYFNKNKKVNYNFFDNDEIIKKEDIYFIKLSDVNIKNNDFSLENNSKILNYFENFILENEEYFESIEKIRMAVEGLIFDLGIKELEKKISNGCVEKIIIENKIVNHELIAKLLMIEYQQLDNSSKKLILLNILCNENINKEIIVYINIDMDDIIYNWINKNENFNYWIDIENSEGYFFKNLFILNNKYGQCLDVLNSSKHNIYNYAFKNQTIKYKEFQKNEISEIINHYLNNNQSIFLEFETDANAKSLAK